MDQFRAGKIKRFFTQVAANCLNLLLHKTVEVRSISRFRRDWGCWGMRRERQGGPLTCQCGRQNITKPEGQAALLSRAFMFLQNDFSAEWSGNGQGTQQEHKKKRKPISLLPCLPEEMPHLQPYPRAMLADLTRRGWGSSPSPKGLLTCSLGQVLTQNQIYLGQLSL